MGDDSRCICCEKEIFEEQDYTTLICHAAGQTISHTTLAHDKCWEKFKKSFVRGRGTSSRTQTFFCPVNGCHNLLLLDLVTFGWSFTCIITTAGEFGLARSVFSRV